VVGRAIYDGDRLISAKAASDESCYRYNSDGRMVARTTPAGTVTSIYDGAGSASRRCRAATESTSSIWTTAQVESRSTGERASTSTTLMDAS